LGFWGDYFCAQRYKRDLLPCFLDGDIEHCECTSPAVLLDMEFAVFACTVAYVNILRVCCADEDVVVE
jgi:hypothetical protein